MTLIKRDPWFGGLSPLLDSDSFFNDFFFPVKMRGDAAGQGDNAVIAPRIDIEDIDDAYVVTADLPGVNKDDINVSIKDGVLTLQAKTDTETKDEQEGKVIRRERHVGHYMRRLNLGSDIDQTDVVADFSDGVLNLRIPKLEPKQPESHRISIR